MATVKELSTRLQTLTTEAELSRRKRLEFSSKVATLLSGISSKDVELLSPIVPALASIAKFTPEVLFENKNGEMELLISVMRDLQAFVEDRLTFYEENL